MEGRGKRGKRAIPIDYAPHAVCSEIGGGKGGGD